MGAYGLVLVLDSMFYPGFRRGGVGPFVVEELKAVFDPRGGAWMEGRYVPSLLAAIGGVIERHMIDIGFLQPREAASGEEQRAVVHLGTPAAHTQIGRASGRESGSQYM